MGGGPVVVGMDGSAASRRALQWAAGLARALDGPVVAVHAAGLLDAAHGEPAGEPAAHERLAAWCAPLAGGPVPYRMVVRDGCALDVLPAVVAEEGATLLVVGSRGTGADSARALGSTSLHLLQAAPVPVLVVPDHGGPGPAATATALDADLIVMGTRGRIGPEDLAHASVARGVADAGQQPVPLVPAETAKEECHAS
jgi:nucleotide-binding universal stress UspA family protein